MAAESRIESHQIDLQYMNEPMDVNEKGGHLLMLVTFKLHNYDTGTLDAYEFKLTLEEDAA